MAGNIPEVFFLTEETHLGKMLFQVPGKVMLDGKVRGGHDVLQGSLIVYIKSPAAVH